MKFVAASSFILASLIAPRNNGADAFAAPSSLLRPGATALRSSLESADPYASILDKLLSATSSGGLVDVPSSSSAANAINAAAAKLTAIPASGTAPTASDADVQKSLLEALASVSEAANAAAAKSAEISATLGTNSAYSPYSPSSAAAANAISATQYKLPSLDAGMASSTIDIESSSQAARRALIEALDASVHAAERAVATTSTLTDSLMQMDATSIMAQSSILHGTSLQQFMSVENLEKWNIISLENMDVGKKKIAEVIDSLSGVHGGGIKLEDNVYLQNLLAKLNEMENVKLDGTVNMEVVQAKLSSLLPNLSGLKIDSTYVQDMLSKIDSMMDNMLSELPQGVVGRGGESTTALIVLYASLVLIMVGYSQRQAGVDAYKSEIRRKLEMGNYDVDELAKDVGYIAKSSVTVSNEVEQILIESKSGAKKVEETPALVIASVAMEDERVTKLVDPVLTVAAMAEVAAEKIEQVQVQELEDPALTMASMTEAVAEEPERAQAELEDPALAMASMANTYVEKMDEKQGDMTFTPMPPKEDPSLITMAAVMESINPESSAVLEAVIATSESSIPELDVGDVATVEIAAKEEPKINIFTTKKAPRKKISKPLPPASPLARLLAEELGLELFYIGKGSGKNGKILVEDVRSFHARLEEAKKSISTSGAYFAMDEAQKSTLTSGAFFATANA